MREDKSTDMSRKPFSFVTSMRMGLILIFV